MHKKMRVSSVNLSDDFYLTSVKQRLTICASLPKVKKEKQNNNILVSDSA